VALVTRPPAEAEQVVAIEVLGEALAGLRLASDEALRRMRQSLTRHGQLSALAAYATETGGLEVVDGFKRLRAARELRLGTLRVHVVARTAVHAKVAVRMLNEVQGLSELEEAWLCRSLYREDGLTQPEIGRLLDRHKSWVCRRLILAEALDEAVQADVRLGLLGTAAALAVARLPRGNQRTAADVVVRRGLTLVQTERLVAAVLACPDDAGRAHLLAEVPPSAATTHRRGRELSAAEWIVADASAVTRLAARLQARLLGQPLAALGEPAALVVEALRGLAPILAALHRQLCRLTGKEAADVDLDHPRGARSPGRDPVPAGPDPPCDRSSARGQPQHGPQDPRGARPGA
jgi:ParB-like chromosome segregation protein Spo0J